MNVRTSGLVGAPPVTIAATRSPRISENWLNASRRASSSYNWKRLYFTINDNDCLILTSSYWGFKLSYTFLYSEYILFQKTGVAEIDVGRKILTSSNSKLISYYGNRLASSYLWKINFPYSAKNSDSSSVHELPPIIFSIRIRPRRSNIRVMYPIKTENERIS